MIEEHAFHCPYCGEPVTMTLDLSVAEQHYIEDCEVCCQPIEVNYTTDDTGVAMFSAQRGDD